MQNGEKTAGKCSTQTVKLRDCRDQRIPPYQCVDILIGSYNSPRKENDSTLIAGGADHPLLNILVRQTGAWRFYLASP